MVAVVLSADEAVGAACRSELAAAGHEVIDHHPAPDVLVVVAPLAAPGVPSTVDPRPFGADASSAIDAALAAMVEAEGGRVVVVVGPTGLPGQTYADHVASVSGALVGQARAAAREVAASGVTVNVVRVGALDTPELAAAAAADPGVAEAVATVVARAPLAHRPAVADVAAAVTFLASDEASYVTGIVLPVDGGLGIGQGT